PFNTTVPNSLLMKTIQQQKTLKNHEKRIAKLRNYHQSVNEILRKKHSLKHNIKKSLADYAIKK
ncbi:MAG: hypothetical protein JW798_04910, partial [Prolixibacteraceae bacterium]|nr:hypothetical protein [Prolixibacteraceae bacterium]